MILEYTSAGVLVIDSQASQGAVRFEIEQVIFQSLYFFDLPYTWNMKSFYVEQIFNMDKNRFSKPNWKLS